MRRAKNGVKTEIETNIHLLIKGAHMTTHTKVPILKTVLNKISEGRAMNLYVQEDVPTLFVTKFITPTRQMERKPNTPETRLLLEYVPEVRQMTKTSNSCIVDSYCDSQVVKCRFNCLVSDPCERTPMHLTPRRRAVER